MFRTLPVQTVNKTIASIEKRSEMSKETALNIETYTNQCFVRNEVPVLKITDIHFCCANSLSNVCVCVRVCVCAWVVRGGGGGGVCVLECVCISVPASVCVLLFGSGCLLAC